MRQWSRNRLADLGSLLVIGFFFVLAAVNGGWRVVRGVVPVWSGLRAVAELAVVDHPNKVHLGRWR